MVMKVFRKEKVELTGSKIPRISKLSDSELASWFNVAAMEVGVHFDAWRHHDGPTEEVDTVLEALTELWAEIKERENGQSSS